ncbi:hypothetical protein ACLOJK_022446 [Asimina triloba]
MKTYNLRDRFRSPRIREGDTTASSIDLDSSMVQDVPFMRTHTTMPHRRQPTKRPSQSVLDEIAAVVGSFVAAVDAESETPVVAAESPPLAVESPCVNL